jgi:hypothetical protein
MKYILIILLFTSCTKQSEPVKHSYETDEVFYVSEVLAPDSIHRTTLVVDNPEGLQRSILLAECWEDVQEGLKLNCKQLK